MMLTPLEARSLASASYPADGRQPQTVHAADGAKIDQDDPSLLFADYGVTAAIGAEADLWWTYR
jgi:hypothetical protein